MSSLWKCPVCILEGESPLWTQKRTDFGVHLACPKCLGRLRLVPLGAGDAEAQAWLEAHHVGLALEEDARQQVLLAEAQAQRDIKFIEAIDYELEGER